MKMWKNDDSLASGASTVHDWYRLLHYRHVSLYISNLFDPDPQTLQTDKQTTCNLTQDRALHYIVHRAVKKNRGAACTTCSLLLPLLPRLPSLSVDEQFTRSSQGERWDVLEMTLRWPWLHFDFVSSTLLLSFLTSVTFCASSDYSSSDYCKHFKFKSARQIHSCGAYLNSSSQQWRQLS